MFFNQARPMETPSERIRRLELDLPSPPTPGGSYVPWRRHGDLIFLSGVISVSNGSLTHTGKVGEAQTLESGREAARVCALNVLAVLQEALGSIDEVESILYLGGYVNAVAGFAQSPQVINGASELLVEVFGEAGRHARAAVAVAGLPADATVEIQVTAAIREEAIIP